MDRLKLDKETIIINDIIKRSKKAVNPDLELFKNNVRRQVKLKKDTAASILKQWLIQ